MNDQPELHIPSAEQLLINTVFCRKPTRILTTTLGRGQLACHLANQHPDVEVVCHFLDVYRYDETRNLIETTHPRIRLVCHPDLPKEEFTVVALPFHHQGEAELTRDLIQQAYDRLSIDGELFCSVDAYRDTWLQHELEKLGKSISRVVHEKRGVVYRLTKKRPLKKLKDFTCEFAFRDQERLIRVVTRPGVFSHRSLDLGARALLESIEIKPGSKVLEIGCGSGAVAFAVAFRAEGVTVHCLDSHTRAIECTLAGAELNGLSGVTCHLTTTGEISDPGTYDIALGNPPYYSHHRIAEIFLQSAHTALKRDGIVSMVTKQADWMSERMAELFEDVFIREVRTYRVLMGRKK